MQGIQEKIDGYKAEMEGIVQKHKETSEVYKNSEDLKYNADNPMRRSPNLDRTRSLFSWKPKVMLQEALERTLVSHLEMLRNQV